MVLDNIRSLHNVGSIFRTADAAGVSKIYLAGFTPSPLDIFGKLRPDFKKTALGAEHYVRWEIKKTVGSLISGLKSEKIFIAAVEQSKKSVSYRDFYSKYHKKFKKYSGIALILGNEVRGISKSILQKSDAIIEIPMRGRKESLNVSVAAGIALFELVAGFGDNFS